jgi:hypothetical protein
MEYTYAEKIKLNLDADIIFDVSLHEIPSLKERLTNIRDSLTTN